MRKPQIEFTRAQRGVRTAAAACLLLVPILARDVIFRHFVCNDFALVRVTGVFHAFHHFRLKRVALFEQLAYALRIGAFPAGQSLQITRLPGPPCSQPPRFERHAVHNLALSANSLFLRRCLFRGNDFLRRGLLLRPLFPGSSFLPRRFFLRRFLLTLFLGGHLQSLPFSFPPVHTNRVLSRPSPTSTPSPRGISNKNEEEVRVRVAPRGEPSRPTNVEFHKLQFPWFFPEIQPRHRHRQLKSPRSGAPRIDVQHAIAFRLSVFVGMPADDDAKASRR